MVFFDNFPLVSNCRFLVYFHERPSNDNLIYLFSIYNTLFHSYIIYYNHDHIYVFIKETTT